MPVNDGAELPLQRYGLASFLVTCHLLFNTICTQALASTTKLLDNRKAPDRSLIEIFRTLLPLATFTGSTLILGNAAYIQINVAAIHMLKALTPVLVCILLFMAGLSDITWAKCRDIAIISGGIMVASAGWGHPAFAGVAMQVAATSVDAARLVVAETALAATGMDMEPLALVYHLAPLVCTVSLVPTFAMVAPTLDEVLENWHLLVGSCVVSFLFDIAGFTVVKKTSSLTLSICGILADVILVGLSVRFWHNTLEILQIFGCVLALAGVVQHLHGNYYKSKGYGVVLGEE